MTTPSIPTGFDFTDPDLLASRLPIAEFAELRRTAPVWWCAQPDRASGFDDGGYWVVSKLAHIKEISKNPEVFSSHQNTAIIRFNEETTREQIDMLGDMLLLNLDPPKHTKTRR
ncbi:steroid C27-monooxygenase, partial [Nocardia gipuzkoensis]